MGISRFVTSKPKVVRGLIYYSVSFVGIISNVHSLCTTASWLAWICNLPGVVVSLIQGFLPSVLLALLFMLVPIFLRILARLEGIPQKTGVELSLMDRFFLFQVIVCIRSFIIE
jgi:calcium permeable stress-gated cation channel